MPLAEPEKLYHSIGEVSRLTELPASVLRYWETEFDFLRPPKSRAGKRTYRKADIDRVLRIKKLLYEDGFTIAGARKFLKEAKDGDRFQADEIRRGLKEILKLLSR